MVHTMVQRLGWQLVGLGMLLMLFFPNIMYMLGRSSISRANRMREDYIIHNGNHGGMGAGWSPYYEDLKMVQDDGNACSSLRRRKIVTEQSPNLAVAHTLKTV